MTSTSISNTEEIKKIVLQLPIEELIKLQAAIDEKIATFAMMQLAETGFAEWDDPEEDIFKALAL